ncbi:DUF2796 domain-containing protein [Marinobacterium sedimentorum]|uniref:DUF2796 domain-containing protein n=1 Tax=Marinobacterium sedimentorum TaxID=2927804 RepID=UPI0020C6CB6B|nr:DUF2796 domain-containing protein [Marinobacterium sedimentorum]MCP8688630.1 DUF2796 domain-containing protein [Marinobacterium sedimentorum]
MSRKNRIGAKLRVAMIVAVLGVAAGTGASHGAGFEQQYDGHVHGAAQLDLVQDGDALMLQLRSPAMNLVGFEHRAGSASERQSVEAALEWLHRAEQLIDLDAVAGCTLTHTMVTQGLQDTGELSETAEHGHAEEHDHAEADEAHDPDGQGEAERAHTDFEANYAFHCTAPEKLASIGLRFFARFPGLEILDVRMITADGQRALRLDSQHTDIGLR